MFLCFPEYCTKDCKQYKERCADNPDLTQCHPKMCDKLGIPLEYCCCGDEGKIQNIIHIDCINVTSTNMYGKDVQCFQERI